MSTYTDLHMCRRENLTILRRPGTAEDGITPQRVIFANPDNIYEGSFKGKIDSTDVKLSNVTLTDVTINGGTINDAMIKSDGQVISMVELTSNVSEISGKLDGAIEVISASVMDEISAMIDDCMSSLSDEIHAEVDSEISTLSNALTSEIADVSSFLSNAIYSEQCERVRQDGILDGKIYTVAKNLSSHVETFNEFSSAMSSAFDAHVEDNISTFNILSTYLLSTLEHDRHYVIYHPSPEKIPYEAKDFAINIIKTGTLDVKVMDETGQTIGYGTFQQDDGSHEKLEIRLDISQSPDLMNYVFNQPTYSDVLVEGIEQTVKTNNAYRIQWTKTGAGQQITLRKNASTESCLKSRSHGDATIGYITDPTSTDPESGNVKFLSGTIYIDRWVQPQDFSVFFDAFNGRTIVSGETLVNDELSCSISHEAYDNRYACFRFDKDIETRWITPLMTDGNVRFGFVREDGLAKDDVGNIVSLTAEGILLPPQCQGYLSTAVLDDSTEPKFMTSLNNGFWISTDVNGNSAVFDVVELKQMYKYDFHSADELELPFNNKGYVVPDLVNKTIAEVSDDFEYLSVMTEFVDDDHVIEWKNTYCLARSIEPAMTTWRYENGDPTGTTSDYVKIIATKIGQAYTLNINFKDHQTGFELKDKTYTIDVSNPHEYPDGSESTHILRSKPIEFTFDTEERIPGTTFFIYGEEPVDVEGDTYSLPVEDFDETGLEIKAPSKLSSMADISREFIVTTYVDSRKDFIEVVLRNAGGDRAGIVSPGHHKFMIPTRQWTSFKVTEIVQDKYLFTDLDDVMIRRRFDKIERDLSNEVSARISADFDLSSAILSNKNEIDEIWKNIRGGLNYQKTLSINQDYDTVKLFISDNYDGQPPMMFREGFFYVIQAQDKHAHYSVEGIEIEHGDWLIINHNVEFPSLTSAYIDIFDAEDYDNFKLSGDNNATGNNTFNGQTTFNGPTVFNGESNLVSGATSISGELSIAATTMITGKTDVVGEISIASIEIQHESVNSSIVNSLSVANMSAYSIDTKLTNADNADISKARISDLTVVNELALSLSAKSLSAELSDFYYNNGLSTLGGLTSDLQSQLSSAQLSIDGISSFIAKKTPCMMHYYGTLSSGYGQQMTLEQFLHENFDGDDSHQFLQGDQYRISAEISLIDDGLRLFANDYITFNADVVLSDVVKGSIDIVRDAQSEGEALQKQIDALCSYVLSDLALSVDEVNARVDNLSGELNATSSYIVSALQLSAIEPLHNLSSEVGIISTSLAEDIVYLSSELSDYHNTLSGIDRGTDYYGDISSDNLILTDVNTAGGQEHGHQRYYMTFLSGTIVLKPIMQ